MPWRGGQKKASWRWLVARRAQGGAAAEGEERLLSAQLPRWCCRAAPPRPWGGGGSRSCSGAGEAGAGGELRSTPGAFAPNPSPTNKGSRHKTYKSRSRGSQRPRAPRAPAQRRCPAPGREEYIPPRPPACPAPHQGPRDTGAFSLAPPRAPAPRRTPPHLGPGLRRWSSSQAASPASGSAAAASSFLR